MSRDSGSKDPSQRTVAELLAEHGGGAQRGSRRRRRRAEDPSETAPQAIIERVNSDSGRMRPVEDPESAPGRAETTTGTAEPTGVPPAGAASTTGAQPAVPPAQEPPVVPPTSPPAGQPPPERGGGGGRRRNRPGPTIYPRGSGQSPAPAAPEPDGGEQPTGGAAPAPEDRTGAPEESAAPQQWGPASGNGPAEQTPVPAPEDTEVTARQPVLRDAEATPAVPTEPAPGDPPTVAGEVPHRPAAEPTAAPDEGEVTERFPPVAEGPAAEPAAAETSEDTTLLEYPVGVEAPASGEESAEAGDPYELAYREPTAPEDPFAEADDFYDGTEDPEDPDTEGTTSVHPDEDSARELRELPAGLDEDVEDEPDEEVGAGRSRALEWTVLLGQVAGGVVAGGLVWIGFRWLWQEFPLPALAAALAFTGVLVLVARKLLRSDDLQTVLLSVLVGLACTVSPVALLLVGY
ncbi:hypothetical protein [Actinopolyspora mortivallis]|uniref:hypothetical protein n=1 Tax=Actinopolyspora mortivallis TaxID=33906 RepID=UPI000371AAE7|nr:hypothetical protein [Actinopolyspora mortivallis]